MQWHVIGHFPCSVAESEQEISEKLELKRLLENITKINAQNKLLHNRLTSGIVDFDFPSRSRPF